MKWLSAAYDRKTKWMIHYERDGIWWGHESLILCNYSLGNILLSWFPFCRGVLGAWFLYAIVFFHSFTMKAVVSIKKEKKKEKKKDEVGKA